MGPSHREKKSRLQTLHFFSRLARSRHRKFGRKNETKTRVSHRFPRASPSMKSIFEALASAFARLDGGSSVRSANGCDEFADASGEFDEMATTTTAAAIMHSSSAASSSPPATPPSSRGGHYRDGVETCHPLPLPLCASEGRLTVRWRDAGPPRVTDHFQKSCPCSFAAAKTLDSMPRWRPEVNFFLSPCLSFVSRPHNSSLSLSPPL